MTGLPLRSFEPKQYLCALMGGPKTVAFHTLGCKLNFSETSSLTRLMEEAGFEKRAFDSLADVYVINTCSVTENADKECRYLVRQIQRKSPKSFVVITGCYAQLKPAEIAGIPGVDLVLGAAEKFNLVEHIAGLTKGDPAKICSCDIDEVQGFHDGFSYNDRTRAFLKVQDGCDYSCSFCTIPLARGRSRSDTVEHAVQNVRSLASKGIQEVVLTGVNLGDFGYTVDGDPAASRKKTTSFLELVKALDQLDAMPRFRISSIEPNLLSNEIIELVANSDRFMPHFHIPLQSGSNKILAAMRRRYRRELYAERVALIKTLMPHAAIGADVIVGFPGESDEDFRETFDFLHEIDVSYLHVFTYSERDNTHALDIKPVVPVPVRNERNKTLRNLSFQKQQYFQAQHAGQERKVLFERSRKKGMMEGYTDNYISVTTPFREDWLNKILAWKL
ncbi:MAG TPA: tRNA (N(6)-L-threonylcarbamoyladenosine(37)-C(2))-methylthiotransferase MtaB [Puia sp.]|nr:tRNA (N(6)-L-threonylcarbamoyladenosine(37)-C(2))-methylthiotransferase MtaB [Puia sp.]